MQANRPLLDKRQLLKIKVKSLAAEARIIRHEELRGGPLRAEMYHHRTTVVRFEARAAHLAYGLIRGRSIAQMEPNPRLTAECTAGLMDKVRAMVKKYGPQMPKVKLDLVAAPKAEPVAA